MHEGENHFWTALEVKVGSLEYHDAHASSDNKTMLEELASRSTKKVILSDVEFLVDKCVKNNLFFLTMQNVYICQTVQAIDARNMYQMLN